jgi:hypothetical protein
LPPPIGSISSIRYPFLFFEIPCHHSVDLTNDLQLVCRCFSASSSIACCLS